MRPAARQAVLEGMERWANPSSPHADGRAARAALEDARARLGAALGGPHTILFTSGATEAAAIAIGRATLPGPVIRSAVEHDAVRRASPGALVAPVRPDGILDSAALATLLRGHPRPLVAVQHVNSETGVVQPIDELLDQVHAAGGLLFVDCAQSAGKLPLPDADMIAVSAHKLGGPPGIGALLVRDLASLHPTGGQEGGYRGGTENLPAILGFAAAAGEDPATSAPAPWMIAQSRHRAMLDALIAEEGGALVCPSAPRNPLIASYRMPNVDANAQLIRFDLLGFSVSAGSACSSGSMRPSHVLDALSLPAEQARQIIRVSFGRDTAEADIQRFGAAWQAMARGARTRAAA